jgi:lia operon protein LiaG
MNSFCDTLSLMLASLKEGSNMKIVKKGSKTKIVFYAALILLVIGLAGTFISFRSDTFSFGGVEVHQTKNIENMKIEHLSIESSSTDVEVKSANRNNIKVELTGRASKKIKNDFQLMTKESGNNLLIMIKRKGVSVNFGVDRVKVVVTVPSNHLKKLKVDTESGDQKIYSLALDQAELNASSGDIQAYRLEVKETLGLQSQSGDIKTNDSNMGDLSVHSSSGDITGNELKARSSQIEASSGDIDLQGVNGDINTKTGSGDVLIKQKSLLGNINIETGSGDGEIRMINVPKSVAVDFNGGSGDGDIQLDGLKTEAKSEHKVIGKIGDGHYKVKVRTGSGDFTFK